MTPLYSPMYTNNVWRIPRGGGQCYLTYHKRVNLLKIEGGLGNGYPIVVQIVIYRIVPSVFSYFKLGYLVGTC